MYVVSETFSDKWSYTHYKYIYWLLVHCEEIICLIYWNVNIFKEIGGNFVQLSTIDTYIEFCRYEHHFLFWIEFHKWWSRVNNTKNTAHTLAPKITSTHPQSGLISFYSLCMLLCDTISFKPVVCSIWSHLHLKKYMK